MPTPSHIYLTGYRGTGKTSVGKILANRLNRQLIDLDDLIEQFAGKTIQEIFTDGGESTFRDIETECLSKVASKNGSVISLGGGAILRKENRTLINQSGVCVWLDADPVTIAERIQNDETSSQRRPALTQLGQLEEICQLLAVREPLYREAAQHCVNTTGKSIQAIASEIARLLDE